MKVAFLVKMNICTFDLRFVKCRDLGFARPVHREKAPTMAHHYLWGSKALNIANNTIYSQYSGDYLLCVLCPSLTLSQIFR